MKKTYRKTKLNKKNINLIMRKLPVPQKDKIKSYLEKEAKKSNKTIFELLMWWRIDVIDKLEMKLQRENEKLERCKKIYNEIFREYTINGETSFSRKVFPKELLDMNIDPELKLEVV